MLTSIIIPSHNEGANTVKTVKNIVANTDQFRTPYEIIVVENGSNQVDKSIERYGNTKLFTTSRMGVSGTKNFGVRASRGDTLLFLDAHMAMHHKWLEGLLNLVENENCIAAPAIYDISRTDSIGYGFTFSAWDLGMKWLSCKRAVPYEIPLAGGACMLMKRPVFDFLGGFDEGLKQWGREDSELSVRAWTMGVPVLVNPKVKVGHLFRKKFPYKVENAPVNRNILRVAYTHFNKFRIENVKRYLKRYPDFRKSYLSNMMSDIIFRRFWVQSKRVHDDDWFFEKFDIRP